MVSLRDASKDDAKAPSFSTRFRIRSAARRAGEDVIDDVRGEFIEFESDTLEWRTIASDHRAG